MNLEVDGTKKIILVEESQGIVLNTQSESQVVALAGVSVKGPQGEKGDKGDIGLTGIVSASNPLIYNVNNRSLSLDTGIGSTQVVLGNDSRLSDSRTPLDASVTDAKINGTLSQYKITDLVSNLSSINTFLNNKSDIAHTHTTINNFLTINGDPSGANALNALSANNKKIIHVADPVADDDAASKQYVDRVSVGIQTHDSVRAATTGPITLSGPQTIDGVSNLTGNGTSTSNRVLVKNQSDAKQNGIYYVNSNVGGAWQRADDMSGSTNALWKKNVVGAYIYVNEGNTLANVSYLARVANTGVETIDGNTGDCTINFGKFSSLSINAGGGISVSGPTISAVGSNSINASGSSINVITKSEGGISIGTSGIYINSNAITSDMLSPSGVTPNTYTKIQVDNKGRITSGGQAAPTDLSPAAATTTHPHVIRTSNNFIIQGNIVTSSALPVPPFFATKAFPANVAINQSIGTMTLIQAYCQTYTGSVNFQIKQTFYGINGSISSISGTSVTGSGTNWTSATLGGSGIVAGDVLFVNGNALLISSVNNDSSITLANSTTLTGSFSQYSIYRLINFGSSTTVNAGTNAIGFPANAPISNGDQISLVITGIAASPQNLTVTLIFEHRLN